MDDGSGGSKLPAGITAAATTGRTSVSKPRQGTATTAAAAVGVFQVPFVVHLGVSYTAVKLVRYALMMWLPFYLQDRIHLDAASAAYVAVLFDVGGGVGSPLCGIVADRVFGRFRWMCRAADVDVRVRICGVYVCVRECLSERACLAGSHHGGRCGSVEALRCAVAMCARTQGGIAGGGGGGVLY